MRSPHGPIDLSWEDVESLTRQLADAIRASGYKPEYLIGITVSGLFPLGLLAKEFDTKDVAVVSARSYDDRTQGKLEITALPKVDLRGKDVLLVDEIADRGTTLKHISEVITRDYGVRELKTATLVINKENCEHRPDFYVREVDTWVVFPWDKAR